MTRREPSASSESFTHPFGNYCLITVVLAALQKLGTAVLDRPSHIPRNAEADAVCHPHPNAARHRTRHVRAGELAVRSRGWTEDCSELANDLSLLGETLQSSPALCHCGSHCVVTIICVQRTRIDPTD